MTHHASVSRLHVDATTFRVWTSLIGLSREMNRRGYETTPETDCGGDVTFVVVLRSAAQYADAVAFVADCVNTENMLENVKIGRMR